MFPEDLKYTSEHEWLRDPGQADGSVRVGITEGHAGGGVDEQVE